MKKAIKGFTIIEALIGITLLGVIMGGILGAFIVVQRYFKDGDAMVKSQATARIVIEKIVRPDVREGSSFYIDPTYAGNKLEVDRFDGLQTTTFTFDNGDDNDDETFADNTIKKNGSTIGTNIVKIPDPDNPGGFLDVFKTLVANERVGINFGVKNEGIVGRFKEVHISTEMKLRN